MSHETLMEELPTNLRIQLLSIIFEKNNLHSIKFFEGKNPYFIIDILPMLKRISLEKDEVIYGQGDWIDESIYIYIFIYLYIYIYINLVYFVLKGSVNLVSDDHFAYRTIEQGAYLGETEIINNIVN